MDIRKETTGLKIRILQLSVLLFLYAAIIIPFTGYLKSRPISVKLGYLPDAEVLKAFVGDQRYLLAEMTIIKVLFYFGSVIENIQNKIETVPEYFTMFKTIETSIKMDPYNEDAYYFAQAVFVWEARRPADVNRLHLYGMKFRTEDPNLPFYIAFNAAYFLKDYATASHYMKKAAEMTGNSLYSNLTARYFYESGRTDIGIVFLDSMEKSSRDKNIKQLYRIRKEALQAVRKLENAVDRFKRDHRRMPVDLEELVSRGLISAIPDDPYGGRFYLSKNGMIRSTSKFAFKPGNEPIHEHD